ncbi:MAG TPA: helix-turn-helix domain-containing protein [Clostridiales bacterium]|nr:helix-turn-helix domain-containing protein [Clostridiales bacterium]
MPKGMPNKRYTAEFKQMVVETMRAEKLSYCEAARQFHVSCNKRVASWERIYLEEGPEGLYRERRGRAGVNGNTKQGRKPKRNKKVKEDLIAEVQRLRAENDYLKKLNALVLEEERRDKGHT